MSKVVVKVDKQGLKELRQSDEVLQLVEKTARAEWGGHTHHHITTFVGYDRAKAILRLNTTRYPG